MASAKSRNSWFSASNVGSGPEDEGEVVYPAASEPSVAEDADEAVVPDEPVVVAGDELAAVVALDTDGSVVAVIVPAAVAAGALADAAAVALAAGPGAPPTALSLLNLTWGVRGRAGEFEMMS